MAWQATADAVAPDIVDGTALVNGLAGAEAAARRRRLWAGLSPTDTGEPHVSAPAAPARR
ncbi:MAG: hypothetical protein ACR2MO_00280 [Acidimicrobiales bacterium]